MSTSEEEQTYRIVRFFKDDDSQNRTILDTGLTLEEAQAHCNDPETSSSTCTNEVGLQRTERYGAWFDGYEREEESGPLYVVDGDIRTRGLNQ